MMVKAISNLRGEGLKFHLVPNIIYLNNCSSYLKNEVNSQDYWESPKKVVE
tara:strand:- start:173 stop:325 length:153 start_codon:yes stop_codon:yes gene_type:complete